MVLPTDDGYAWSRKLFLYRAELATVKCTFGLYYTVQTILMLQVGYGETER